MDTEGGRSCGSKIATGLALPLDLDRIEPIEDNLARCAPLRLLVAQDTERGALAINRAERSTTSPRTVYSIHPLGTAADAAVLLPVVTPKRPMSSSLLKNCTNSALPSTARVGSSGWTSGGSPKTNKNRRPLSSTRNLLSVPSCA